MNPKDQVRELLRKTPRPDSIDSTNKAKAFKRIHSESIKKFKDGRCTEQAASGILTNLQQFF